MACSAHRFHVPAQPASDSHHVIPQAWQRYWHPAISPLLRAPFAVTQPFSGAAWDLWDHRTVELCPSCHRGVHERIVRLMKHREQPSRDRLWAIATLALERYTAAGGNLDDLRAARLYGEQ